MAKASGGTRAAKPTKLSVSKSRSIYKYEISMPDIEGKRSYFSEKSGGYMLFMKGRKFDTFEDETARAMADAGFFVVLTPEGGVKFRTAKSKKKEGDYVYSDGLVQGFTYEQQTKKPINKNFQNLVNSVDNALQHAKNKGAQIPLIYDKYASYHREHIEAGIEQFENNCSYRFKAILVVDSKKNVWQHIHNKKRVR